MLHLEVYEEATSPKPRMVLRLHRDKHTGDVFLSAVEANTGYTVSRGNLFRISENGTIWRCGSVEPKLGFQLDKKQRVILENNEGG